MKEFSFLNMKALAVVAVTLGLMAGAAQAKLIIDGDPGSYGAVQLAEGWQESKHFKAEASPEGGVSTGFVLPIGNLISIDAGMLTLGANEGDDGLRLRIGRSTVILDDPGLRTVRDAYGASWLAMGLHAIGLGREERLGAAVLDLLMTAGRQMSANLKIPTVKKPKDKKQRPAHGGELRTLLVFGSCLLGLGFTGFGFAYRREPV